MQERTGSCRVVQPCSTGPAKSVGAELASWVLQAQQEVTTYVLQGIERLLPGRGADDDGVEHEEWSMKFWQAEI